VLDDAELILGMWRHLATYAVAPSTAALGDLVFAGKVYEMAWRLRGSGLSSGARVRAIGIDARIPARELEQMVLPTLESLNWIKVNRGADGKLVSVEAVIPPPSELIAAAPRILDVCGIDALQRAVLEMLRATTLQPLERNAALEVASSHGDEIAEAALRHLVVLHLVNEVEAADGRSAVFNPNIWASDATITEAALKVEDAHVRAEVGALIEELITAPGLPEIEVKSTSQQWIDFAVSQGLIQRSVVQTSENDEKRFLFAPHLGRDPFGVQPGDVSGHVRQLVGSMVYAATFARYKLTRPDQFVSALIRDGEAGDASPIGTDYPMLETGGIVRVVQGSTPEKFRFQLLQADVAEGALKILQSRESGGISRVARGSGDLRSQRTYTHVESERARVALIAPPDDETTRILTAALRQSIASRGVHG